jgi:hypothetical protein
MPGLPPTAGKVLVGPDDDAQACLRIIILALNSKGKYSHEVLRCLDTSRSSDGTILFISVHHDRVVVEDDCFLDSDRLPTTAKVPRHDDSRSSLTVEVPF